MAKMIFFDVDGTLFRHDCRVPESAVRALHKLKANGHYVMLCTGRNRCMLPDEVEKLPLSGMVCGCGTYVSAGEQILTDACLSGPVCRNVIDTLYRYRCAFYIENSDHFYFDENYIPEIFQNAVASMRRNYPDRLCSLSEFPDRISKITGYPETREHLSELKEKLSPWFDVIIHDEYKYIEITLKGYTKGTGVRQLIDTLEIPREDTYGFGDSRNDLPMLETVGHGIVMGDSPDDLKKRYEVTDSLYSDGIEKGLLRLGLI